MLLKASLYAQYLYKRLLSTAEAHSQLSIEAPCGMSTKAASLCQEVACAFIAVVYSYMHRYFSSQMTEEVVVSYVYTKFYAGFKNLKICNERTLFLHRMGVSQNYHHDPLTENGKRMSEDLLSTSFKEMRISGEFSRHLSYCCRKVLQICAGFTLCSSAGLAGGECSAVMC